MRGMMKMKVPGSSAFFYFILFLLLVSLLMALESEEDASMEVDGEVKDGGVPAKKDDLAEYNLDDYDEDDVKEDGMSLSMALASLISFAGVGGPFSNIKGLTYYRDNEDDPYITLKDV